MLEEELVLADPWLELVLADPWLDPWLELVLADPLNPWLELVLADPWFVLADPQLEQLKHLVLE